MNSTKQHQVFMRLAIAEAKKAEAEGGLAIGAVMVKEEKVIATGRSLVWTHKDPSAHSEMICIRNACRELDSLDLSGCTLYGTLEPCHMCLSAAAWGDLSEFNFGAYKEDIPGNKYPIVGYSAEEANKNVQTWTGKKIELKGGVLRQECSQLLNGLQNWAK